MPDPTGKPDSPGPSVPSNLPARADRSNQAAGYTAGRPTVDTLAHAADISPDAPRGPKVVDWALPPHLGFASVFNSTIAAYRMQFDEALRKNQIDALAVRRDPDIHELIRKRQYPVIGTPFHLEPDDPKNPEQMEACEILTGIIEAIPRFQDLKRELKEDIFFGKSAVQVKFGRVQAKGEWRVGIVDHAPVHGDKIGYHFDGTPKIQVNSMFRPERNNRLMYDDRGASLVLSDPYYRQRFLISKFEPTDTDFYFESDMALALHGMGLRNWIYWPWWLRNEVMSWRLDALQRVGSNGMIYMMYDSGSDAARENAIATLKMLTRDNVAAIPMDPGDPGGERIFSIPPAAIGYTEQAALIDELDDKIRRVIVGQNLSGESASTGMGSGVADFQETTFQYIVRSDTTSLQETLTTELLPTLIRRNFGKLDFGIKLILSSDRKDVGERIAAAKMVHDMGEDIDRGELFDAAGLSPPKDDANIVEGAARPEELAEQAAELAPKPSPATSSTGKPGGAKPLPKGSNANLSRATRGAAGSRV